METGHIDDVLISAWFDGELEGPEHQAEKARVEAWLRDHPELAARTRLWAADAEALRSRLSPLLDEPIPEELRATVMRQPPWFSRWALVAASVALVVLGGAIGAAVTWQVQQQQLAAAPRGLSVPANWVQRAAYAHSVYVPEPRHAVEVKAQEEHLARWLTRRIDVPVRLFDLREFGFELVGGRLLPDGPGKSAQLMYQDSMGVRMTIYLRKPELGTEAAFRYERQGELGMFYWVEAGGGYALVGPLPKDQLLAMARSIHQQGLAPAPPLPPPPSQAQPASK